jgi:hypothetical protein
MHFRDRHHQRGVDFGEALGVRCKVLHAWRGSNLSWADRLENSANTRTEDIPGPARSAGSRRSFAPVHTLYCETANHSRHLTPSTSPSRADTVSQTA